MVYLTILGLFLLSSLVEGKGLFTTNLEAFEPIRLKHIRLGKHAELLAQEAKSTGKISSQTVTDYKDLEYLGKISVGTPEQNFTVIMDTGSSTLFVPDISCGKPKCKDYCEDEVFCDYLCGEDCCSSSPISDPDRSCGSKHKFNSSNSSTFEQSSSQIPLLWGMGQANVARDVIRLGATPDNQLTISKAHFGLATQSPTFLDKLPADGVLGLAPGPTSKEDLQPVLATAIALNQLAAPIFTVYLEKRGRSGSVHGGTFTWGGLDGHNCGQVIGWQNVSHETLYVFDVDAFSVGDYAKNGSFRASSDTGFWLIGAKQSLFDAIGTSMGASYNSQERLYYSPCDAELPDLMLSMNGNTYSVASTHMLVHLEENRCLLAIYPLPDNSPSLPDFILGSPFIRAFCHVYDLANSRVGFASSKN